MRILSNLLQGFLLLFIVVFIASAGPEIHSFFLRKYVGSKTVLIKGDGGGGSGFFVKAKSGKTFILTNRHVCDLGKNTLRVVLPGNQRTVTKKIIQRYSKHDLCLIEGDNNYSGLDLASRLYIGQTIGIMGHPKLHPLTLSKGEYIGNRTIKLLLGYDIPKDKCPGEVYPTNFILQMLSVKSACVGSFYSGQITAYSRGGSSGSPIVNFFGNTVGVLFAGNRMDPFESYMVLLHDIRNFLEDY